tara:strand:+ start:7402 stop:7680 length:279 start_codon:yes stop_codon:yes gene_type:complete
LGIIVDNKNVFGNIAASNIDPGDLVQWTKWDEHSKNYDEKFGIVISINEEVRGSRMVSVAHVVPLVNPRKKLEFFTLSLKLISKGSKDTKKD